MLSYSKNGKWKLYWGAMPLPAGAEAIGTITRDIGDTGALIITANGMYIQGNAGSVRTLDKQEVEEALAASSAAAALGRKGGAVKSKAKAKSSAANAKLGGRPRTYMHAVQAFNEDLDQWEYAGNEPLGREQAAAKIKQLRQWAKDDASGKKYRTIKVYLSM